MNVPKILGNVFEEKCETFIPYLTKIDEKNKVTPDFIFEHGKVKLYVEAKIGLYKFGPVPRASQVREFKKLDRPVLYVMGYHLLDRAMTRVNQKTKLRRQNYVRKNMMLSTIYLVSPDIVENIHKVMKKAIMDKGKKSTHCIVREYIFESIIYKRHITYRRKKQCPLKKFSLEDMKIYTKEPVFRDNLPCKVGYIISKKYIKAFTPILDLINLI